MRQVKPASKQRTGYPRLARAWRMLVAAPLAFSSLAHGDATVPDHGTKGPGNGDQKHPSPPPSPPPPQDHPDIAGEMPMPEPPQPPPKKGEKKGQPKSSMVLHRHAPHEPCLPLWRKV
jgi:hypothetical protein